MPRSVPSILGLGHFRGWQSCSMLCGRAQQKRDSWWKNRCIFQNSLIRKVGKFRRDIYKVGFIFFNTDFLGSDGEPYSLIDLYWFEIRLCLNSWHFCECSHLNNHYCNCSCPRRITNDCVYLFSLLCDENEER